jgi:hypothetical protein
MASCLRVAAVGALVLLGVARGATLEKVWLSPDRRWGAGFPVPPEPLDVSASGGAGVGYRAVVSTPHGPAQYIVTLMVADAIKHRPPTSQVREILEVSTSAFVGSVGGQPSNLKTTWSSFGKGLPRLEHELTYAREGVEFETIGFFTMVGTEMIRVSASYPLLFAAEQRPKARLFLTSFVMMTKSKAPTLNDYVTAIALRAGGTAEECPPEIETSMRAGVEEQGGTHLGARCFTFTTTAAKTAASIDLIRTTMPQHGAARPWKEGATGGLRQVERYSDDGIGWWLLPNIGSNGETGLVIQLMQ